MPAKPTHDGQASHDDQENEATFSAVIGGFDPAIPIGKALSTFAANEHGCWGKPGYAWPEAGPGGLAHSPSPTRNKKGPRERP
jgi:hypothetical protein